MTLPSRKKTQIAEREAEILKIAGEILAADGPNALTMERVLARVQFSKGTLYNHFTCSEDLLVALHAQCFGECYDLFARGALFRGRARERMVASALASEIKGRLDPFRVSACMTDEILAAASERWRRTYISVLRENVGVFVGIVRDGIASGDLHPSHDPDTVAASAWSIWVGAEELFRSGMILRGRSTDEFGVARDRMLATLLDGYQWRPLASGHDYEAVRLRILAEVFPDEAERLRIPMARRHTA